MSNAQSKHWGHGWISGTASVSLAAIGLLAVLCFHFPSYLTIPQAREYYPLPLIRASLHLVLVAGFLLGLTSVMLRHNKTLGFIGMGIVLFAALLGGSRVQLDTQLKDDYYLYLGLDYALLILIVYSAIFIPIEKLFGRLEQYVFSTPQFHHWHHGAEDEAIDKNFAVHFPALDLLFGTFFLPKRRWPNRYGVENNDVPEGFLAQLIYPFRRSPRPAAPAVEDANSEMNPATRT